MNGLESLRLSSNPNSFRTAVRLRVYEFVDEAQIRPPLDRPGDFLEPLRRPFGALTGEPRLSAGFLDCSGKRSSRSGLEECELGVAEVPLDHRQARSDGWESHVHVLEELDRKE